MALKMVQNIITRVPLLKKVVTSGKSPFSNSGIHPSSNVFLLYFRLFDVKYHFTMCSLASISDWRPCYTTLTSDYNLLGAIHKGRPADPPGGRFGKTGQNRTWRGEGGIENSDVRKWFFWLYQISVFWLPECNLMHTNHLFISTSILLDQKSRIHRIFPRGK